MPPRLRQECHRFAPPRLASVPHNLLNAQSTSHVFTCIVIRSHDLSIRETHLPRRRTRVDSPVDTPSGSQELRTGAIAGRGARSRNCTCRVPAGRRRVDHEGVIDETGRSSSPVAAYAFRCRTREGWSRWAVTRCVNPRAGPALGRMCPGAVARRGARRRSPRNRWTCGPLSESCAPPPARESCSRRPRGQTERTPGVWAQGRGGGNACATGSSNRREWEAGVFRIAAGEARVKCESWPTGG